MNSEWQPIETAPRDGTLILLSKAGASDDEWPMRCRRWTGEPYPHWRGHDADGATHWMPLPDPPKTDTQPREMRE